MAGPVVTVTWVAVSIMTMVSVVTVIVVAMMASERWHFKAADDL